MKQVYILVITLLASFAGVAQDISLQHVATHNTGIFDEGAAEIVAYDSTSSLIFYSNADANSVGVLDFSDPTSLTPGTDISLDAYGGGVNSVAAHNGYIAVAVEADVKQDNGRIVFFEANGTYVADVEVGALPDMVTFSPDGMKVICANEGEPNDDWTNDPVGSISVIDISGGIANVTQGDVTTLGFDGVTIPNDVRIFGPEGIEAFADDFQEEDTIQFDTNFVNWTVFNLEGSTRTWGEYEFPSGSAELYARISGFDGGCQFQEDYIVSDLIDLNNYSSAYMHFSSAYNFSGDQLELWISEDYEEGDDVFDATWDDISSSVNWPSTDGFTWTHSGEIDLSAYVGSDVAIAFAYTANTDSCSTWQFDSLEVIGEYAPEHNLEPEYVAVSPNSSQAFVALQENNGLAIVDLNNTSISALTGLGWKDHSVAGNGLDPSNEDGGININTYPFRGLYLPDAITSYEVGGQTYVLSANEGDAREYDAYEEEDRLNDIDLDATVFPNASTFQPDDVAGRIKVTLSMGDTDDDGEFEEIYTFGARSFSIWSSSGSLVWDSGDDFEQTVASEYPDHFNSTNDDNDSFDNRSDDKGPEPEAITVGQIGTKWFAFIGLERMGGIMVYDITDPNAPIFIEYVLNRDFSAAADAAAAGDLGPEDIKFISGDASPDGKYYLVTSAEVSGTVSVFEIEGAVGLNELESAPEWSVYPNPVNNTLNISVTGDYRIMDLSGRTVMTISNERFVDVSDLNSGLYFITDEAGAAHSFVKN